MSVEAIATDEQRLESILFAENYPLIEQDADMQGLQYEAWRTEAYQRLGTVALTLEAGLKTDEDRHRLQIYELIVDALARDESPKALVESTLSIRSMESEVALVRTSAIWAREAAQSQQGKTNLAVSPEHAAEADAQATEHMFSETSKRANNLINDLARAALQNPSERNKQALAAELLPLITRYTRSRLGRQESVSCSAEDVAQEVMIATFKALDTYKDRGLSFRAFVYGIASHKVTDAFRAIGRNKSDAVADVPDDADMSKGPEAQLLSNELSGKIAGLLEPLTDMQRNVVILRILEGRSAEEAARILGSTSGAVRVTQHRALGRLRTYLEDPTLYTDALAKKQTAADTRQISSPKPVNTTVIKPKVASPRTAVPAPNVRKPTEPAVIEPDTHTISEPTSSAKTQTGVEASAPVHSQASILALSNLLNCEPESLTIDAVTATLDIYDKISRQKDEKGYLDILFAGSTDRIWNYAAYLAGAISRKKARTNLQYDSELFAQYSQLVRQSIS